MTANFKEQATYYDGHHWQEYGIREKVIGGWTIWELCPRCEALRLIRHFNDGDSRPILRNEPDPTPDCLSSAPIELDQNLLTAYRQGYQDREDQKDLDFSRIHRAYWGGYFQGWLDANMGLYDGESLEKWEPA